MGLNTKGGIKNGLIGGLISSLCCLGPIILTLLGVGTVFGISGFCYKQFRVPFLITGLIFVGIATSIYFRKKRKTCDITKEDKLNTITITLISMVITYFFIIYLLTPRLHAILSTGTCSI